MRSVTLDQFKHTRENKQLSLRISAELKSQYPDVPWREMARLQDILAHQYDRVDPETVWDITQTNIPELLSRLQPILKTFESAPLIFVVKKLIQQARLQFFYLCLSDRSSRILGKSLENKAMRFIRILMTDLKLHSAIRLHLLNHHDS